ncbi:hypothetical protein [Salinicoccus bachuensis]|uniref:Uncharacterized protein n=1 Tax=Salinicoccus bachuensis TaxID=3136731 RepID=A0ABZ3CI01_9STAP
MKIDIYKGPGGHNNHAYLNWRYSKFTKDEHTMLDTMSESYFDSSQILLDAAINNNTDKKADSIIFAILFSFNHYIELKIKAIINSYVYLDKDNKRLKEILQKEENGEQYFVPFPKGHNINELTCDLIKILKDSNLPKIEKTEKRFKYLKSYLSQLNKYQIFKDSKHLDFTRYPLNIKKDRYFYTETTDNITISLYNFKVISTKIEEELSMLYHQLLYVEELKNQKEEYLKELKREIESEYRDQY